MWDLTKAKIWNKNTSLGNPFCCLIAPRIRTLLLICKLLFSSLQFKHISSYFGVLCHRRLCRNFQCHHLLSVATCHKDVTHHSTIQGDNWLWFYTVIGFCYLYLWAFSGWIQAKIHLILRGKMNISMIKGLTSWSSHEQTQYCSPWARLISKTWNTFFQWQFRTAHIYFNRKIISYLSWKVLY